MSPSDHDALRRQLAVCFNKLTKGCEEAERVDQVISSLKETFYDGIRDLVPSWGARTPVSRLPTEILAVCFGYLPLRSRIAVTHVSHGWRAAALAVPAVWSEIDIPRRLRNLEQVVKLFLSRAGNHPIDITLPGDTLRDPGHWPVLTLVNDHLKHVRSLLWGGNIWSFNEPAPMLESLDLPLVNDLLGTGFLGGQSGVLRTLRFRGMTLPDACPAVATVAELDVELLPSSPLRSPLRLSRLFVLFPRLQSLSLGCVDPDHVAVLCGIRPVCPLSKLSLQTFSPDCNVSAVYDAWKTGRMEAVCLGTPLDSITAPKVAACVSTARHLTVRIIINPDSYLPSALVEAVSAEGKKHSLDLSESITVEGGVARLTEALAGAQPSMTQLHSLEIPTTVFAALDVALPAALRMLTLVYADRHVKVDYRCSMMWPSHELEPCVRRLLAQPVEFLIFHVRSYSSEHPISVDEVRAVLREFSPARAGKPEMRIRIRGVPASVADQLASTFHELEISCETEESGHLRV